MCECNKSNEPPYRINIKQTAKKEPYWDVTVRGETKEQLSKLLDEAVTIAEQKIKEIEGDSKARRLIC